jgi:hypothetical protein
VWPSHQKIDTKYMQDGIPNYYSNGTVFHHLYRMKLCRSFKYENMEWTVLVHTRVNETTAL